jgi:hypothetical protein
MGEDPGHEPDCGCIRCSGFDTEVKRRTSVGVFLWVLSLASGRWVLSGVVAVAALRILLLVSGLSGVAVGGSTFLSYLALVGYVSVHAAEDTTGYSEDEVGKVSKVARRTPVAVGGFVAFALVVGSAVAFWVALNRIGLPDVVTLVLLMVTVLWLAVKMVMFPQACFVDGKGPVESIKASWKASEVNRGRLLYVFGFGVLYVAASASLPEFGGSGTALQVNVDIETLDAEVRGGSEPGWRTAAAAVPNAVVTALYAGFLTHLYVESKYA